ncbi:uncharacterized protein LOC126092515 [Schistocerca cancellata]|uniref:uncharacterized protein LOC126092515 n=1 Tax=Schistocerca cancellata TaxID=274614 RepID=UPI00211932CE|nr:uncharacterized protein LOC126092515 [Schistocerca cancellata]
MTQRASLLVLTPLMVVVVVALSLVVRLPAAHARQLSPLERFMHARFPSTTESPLQRDWVGDDYDSDSFDDDDIDDYQDSTSSTAPPPPSPPRQHAPSEPMSPHSQQKWSLMGSRAAVDAFRHSRLKLTGTGSRTSAENEVQLAVENALRVNREHECRVPAARLVRVKDEYPHPNKRYIPHCATLHRCGDDAGCCHSDTLTCVAAKAHPVTLYFYTTTAGSRAVVEKLTFENHTECRCEDKLDAVMPRDMPDTQRPLRGPHHHHEPQQHHSSHAGGCRCPSAFSARRLQGGSSCRCECFGHHAGCARLRRGKDYFSTRDKYCIQSGECAYPDCEYGPYIRKAGRCPRKRERLSAWDKARH